MCAKPVRERRIEDDREPIDGVELTVDDLVALRRLHPRVQAQDPERRHRRADGDERGGQEMHAVRHAVLAEQHDAEKRRLDEKRREHLVAEQRPRDVAGALDEAGPVRAELKAHRDARHDAERERQREDLDPEVIRELPRLTAAARVLDAEEQQSPSEADRHGRKQDVEAHVERELDAGQFGRVELEHRDPSSVESERENDSGAAARGALNVSAALHHPRRSATGRRPSSPSRSCLRCR